MGCGINPRYGQIDPYAMAGCVIDEAVRNCTAVGADPSRIAILDNFCWGNTERPETLGSLVRAAQACHDVSLAYGTPFISGKDSLNNEFTHEGRSLAIPPTLLISAIGIVPDVRSCVTMDLKEEGNLLYVLGMTRCELGGSLWSEVNQRPGGRVPRVDPCAGAGLVPCSPFGDLGRTRPELPRPQRGWAGGGDGGDGPGGRPRRASVSLAEAPREDDAADDFVLLFSESPTRFVLEVRPQDAGELEDRLAGLPLGRLGQVWARPGGARVASPRLTVLGLDGSVVVDASVDDMKAAWQRPLNWP